MKKAIFWDSDGTLLYGNESFACSLMSALEEAGYHPAKDELTALMKRVCTWHTQKDHAHQSGEEWWQELLDAVGDFCAQQGIAPEKIPFICNAFRQKVIAYDYRIYADAQMVLHQFCERGYQNYIISNNFPELDQVFCRLGLAPYITGYILSASAGWEKPRKEIFDHAIAVAGHPKLCYMIGDNPIADYQGGLNGGMKPILVHNRVEGLICCEELTELLDMIKDE
ncbi:MAG: HAD family hydrolase [Clostridiales bacterium]|nr:HAD family hydrolase [Clostridiales bacterium]